MTEKLYFKNSFLYDFVAALMERRLVDGRTALVLDRTAFYPTSGGQVFDTGWIELEPLEGERGPFRPKLRVTEVAETDEGEILHYVESDSGSVPDISAEVPTRVSGFIDVERRRDHMQQHSGQHVISAAFVELFQMQTVSFHMGEQSCTIDLDTKSLSAEQVRKAEERANQVIWEDRLVSMQMATEDEARAMGVRKIPGAGHERLRLISVENFDLCACGGTHVKSTGQIGSVLIRKVEKVKQGMRVEFVCGERAVRHARKDFEVLTEAASQLSTHIWEVPAQIAKSVEESRAAAKQQHRLLERIAELTALEMLARTPEESGAKVIARAIPDGDLAYTKLLAQRLTAAAPNVVALLGATIGQAALVYAQSPGMPHDMGALMKSSMAALGGRGGGNRDMAQGGVPDASKLPEAIEAVRRSVSGS